MDSRAQFVWATNRSQGEISPFSVKKAAVCVCVKVCIRSEDGRTKLELSATCNSPSSFPALHFYLFYPPPPKVQIIALPRVFYWLMLLSLLVLFDWSSLRFGKIKSQILLQSSKSACFGVVMFWKFKKWISGKKNSHHGNGSVFPTRSRVKIMNMM